MSRKTQAAFWSICSNSLLLITKMIVGIISGSVSILSEAIHSAIDLVASCIAFFSVKKSDLPPDEKHPYGHEKIENISGVIESLLIFIAAFWIIYEAIDKIAHPQTVHNLPLGIGVMFISSIINLIVSQYLYRVAAEEDSVALAADALHLKTDVLTSCGVGGGIAIIWIGSLLGYEWHFIDPIIAIIIALFILKEASEMLKQSFNPLLDCSLNPQELHIIHEEIARHFPSSQGEFHQLRTRRSGYKRYIDFHLSLPGEMSVSIAHDICDRIEQQIQQRLPHAEIMIHVEPLI